MRYLRFLVTSLVALLCYSCGEMQPCFGQYVTLTGTLQGSNGTTASNFTINFKPSQMFFVAGTGVVVPTSSACATSTDGSVVGVGNPLTGNVVSLLFSGTLPVGNYFVVSTFYTAAGETLAGPEAAQQVSSTGGLTIAAPVSGVPSTALGMRVYVGTSSGAETLQGQTTGSASFTQSVPLVSGAALPASNTTVCKQVANDAGWPTGTGYVVSMTDTAGNTLPGYPMQWQLMGAGTTINLSSGLPYYHGVVYFPSPLLASPLNHATQSISGGLSLTGYWLTNVGRIGCGTALPGWSVDCPTINASTGFLVGGSGGTVGQCMLSDGTYFDTAALCLTAANAAYQVIDSNGTPVTARPVLNFSSQFTLTDTASPARTNVAIANSGVAAASYTRMNATVGADGRVTAASNGAAVTATFNVVTGSRSFGTAYQNSGTGPMVVSGYAVAVTGSATNNISCVVGPTSTPTTVVFAETNGATVIGGAAAFVCPVVPATYWYKVSVVNDLSGTAASWVEVPLS